ncbi:MAG: T9SS type A sorting domain-containing protein [Saprospiraceae bacterium]|nr:T9SS type A sorting domain-containing protein [Saprospiraceae bacterium]
MKLLFKVLFSCTIFLLFLDKASAQIPFNIQEFSVSEDSIISLSVGDPDADGKDDIFITLKGRNAIYKLRNNGGNSFSIVNYLTAPEPQLVKITTLNGGDDILYTRKSTSGVHILYGKDEWNAERKVGPVVGKDSVNNLVAITSVGSWYPTGSSSPLLFLQDGEGTVYIFAIRISSFNTMFVETLSTFKYDSPIGLISAMHLGSFTRVFVPDIGNKQLRVIQFKWLVPYGPPSFDQELIMDSDLGRPVSVANDVDRNDVRSLFLLDAGRSEVVKYTFLPNSVDFQKSIIPLDIENPEQIHLGRIDSDSLQDLIILENNRIWMITNVAGPRSGFSEKILLAEEEMGIRNLIIRDFDSDGISDIAYNVEGSNFVKILKNEILSSLSDEYFQSECRIFPNPGSGVFKLDNKEFKIVKLSDAQGRDTGLHINSESIDMTSYPTGTYYISVTNGRISKILSIVKI